jgi:excisionase family DNA binding protein
MSANQRVSTGGAARVLECSPEYVRKLVEMGVLRAERIDGRGYYVYQVEDVQKLAAQRKAKKSETLGVTV